MIKLNLLFYDTEAIALFRNAGLEVKTADMPVHVENHHTSGSKTIMTPMLTVTNPKNGNPENIQEFFKKYLESKKDELFLNPGKLDIFNLFNK
jgi:hypothetical protein